MTTHQSSVSIQRPDCTISKTGSPVDQVKDAWIQFDIDSINRLEALYDNDVQFIEPAGHLRGREVVFKHFRDTCQNLLECHFEFNDSLETRLDQQAVLVWEMHYRHSRLKAGKLLSVSGVTLLKFDSKVLLHRDWFDLGEAVYEHIPVLGSIVRRIRIKMHA